jgi:ABC-type multidrug transport system fused ATPase/permease subunit
LPAAEWAWLWGQVRPFFLYQVGSVVFVLLGTATSLTSPLLIKWLIDDILPNRRWPALAVATGLFFAVTISRTVLGNVANSINLLGVMRCTYRLRRRLLSHLLSLPAAFYGEKPIGDLVQRVEADVTSVGDFGSDILPTVVQMVVQIVMTAAVMIFLDWRLTAIIVPLMPVFVWIQHHFGAVMRQSSEHVRGAVGTQSSLLNEMLAGATQIQLLGAEWRMARRYDRLSLRTQRARWRQRMRELRFSLSTMTAVSLGSALIIGYGGARVLTGDLSAGSLVAFYGYVGSIFAPLMTATELYARLNRIEASIRRLREIEQATNRISDAPDAEPLSAPPQRVAYRDVTFSYAPDKLALNGADFEARAGERIAVMGASGCGKSSLLKLIPRLYDVDEGSLEIDGRPVGSVKLRSLRHAISFVPQDPVLFQGTLLDNLRHGEPTASRREVEAAVSAACLSDVVRRLPNGLDTELGPTGGGLSGGEKQRVAIARAILQDRPILILDEATSAIDAPTEHQLLEGLTPWCAGRIVIVVSHRMSTCLWADRVVVFDRGRAVESGSHDELFHPGSFYFDFWQNRVGDGSDASGDVERGQPAETDASFTPADPRNIDPPPLQAELALPSDRR